VKTALAIFAGATVIAVAIYLGLTHQKRTWMEACMKKQGQDESFCENMYLFTPK